MSPVEHLTEAVKKMSDAGRKNTSLTDMQFEIFELKNKIARLETDKINLNTLVKYQRLEILALKEENENG